MKECLRKISLPTCHLTFAPQNLLSIDYSIRWKTWEWCIAHPLVKRKRHIGSFTLTKVTQNRFLIYILCIKIVYYKVNACTSSELFRLTRTQYYRGKETRLIYNKKMVLRTQTMEKKEERIWRQKKEESITSSCGAGFYYVFSLIMLSFTISYKIAKKTRYVYETDNRVSKLHTLIYASYILSKMSL